jgi:hypothetical protein
MSLESRTSGLLLQFFDTAQAHFSEFQLVAIQVVKSVAFPEAAKDSVLMLAIQQLRYRRQGVVLTQGLQQNQWRFSFSVAN